MLLSSKAHEICKFGQYFAKLTISNVTSQNISNVRRMTSFKNKFFWKPHRHKANPRPKMSVILLEDHLQLGRKGEVAKVERGYARHDLIPNELADYATKENLIKYGCTENANVARASLKLLNKIQKIHLKMGRPRDEPWEIGKHHIAFSLQKMHSLHVPVHCIDCDFEAISEFGEYEVNVTVNKEATVPIKVSVSEWVPEYKEGWKEILAGETKVEEEASCD